jgi:hypothetical protein
VAPDQRHIFLSDHGEQLQEDRLMRAGWIAIVLIAAGCGRAPEDATRETPAAASDAAATTATHTADANADDAIAGLPPEAVALPNEQGRKLWAVKRPDNRAMVYEQLPDGMLSGTGGSIEELPEIYPGVDFSALKDE